MKDSSLRSSSRLSQSTDRISTTTYQQWLSWTSMTDKISLFSTKLSISKQHKEIRKLCKINNFLCSPINKALNSKLSQDSHNWILNSHLSPKYLNNRTTRPMRWYNRKRKKKPRENQPINIWMHLNLKTPQVCLRIREIIETKFNTFLWIIQLIKVLPLIKVVEMQLGKQQKQKETRRLHLRSHNKSSKIHICPPHLFIVKFSLKMLIHLQVILLATTFQLLLKRILPQQQLHRLTLYLWLKHTLHLLCLRLILFLAIQVNSHHLKTRSSLHLLVQLLRYTLLQFLLLKGNRILRYLLLTHRLQQQISILQLDRFTLLLLHPHKLPYMYLPTQVHTLHLQLWHLQILMQFQRNNILSLLLANQITQSRIMAMKLPNQPVIRTKPLIN